MNSQPPGSNIPQVPCEKVEEPFSRFAGNVHTAPLPSLDLLRHLAAMFSLLQFLPLAYVFGALLLSGAFDFALFAGGCGIAPLANVLALWPLQRRPWAGVVAIGLNLLWMIKSGLFALSRDPSEMWMLVMLAMFPQFLALVTEGIALGLHFRAFLNAASQCKSTTLS